MTTTSATNFGTLYVVATPIGNLDDITLRALDILKTVDVILAEDTRHSLQLLTNFGINKPLQSLHDHNERSKVPTVLQRLRSGSNIALLSDAGTPLISDPGFLLVKSAREDGLPVVPVPGACAMVTALQAAGVACDSFTFCGFLPAKAAARRLRLQELQLYPQTLVFYESTHRIKDLLSDVAAIFGVDTELVIAKELTKQYESFWRGSSAELSDLLQDPKLCKGEFVVILPAREVAVDKQNDEKILQTLLAELPLKAAVKIASQLTTTSKNTLYKMALEFSGD